MASAKPKTEESVTKDAESVYTATELMENHSVFHVSREIVAVALKKAKKDSATFAEAKEIIDNFKSRRIS